MKKILLALIAVAFASSLCFAQQPPTPVSKPKLLAPVEIKTLTGKVDSVTIGEPAKGTKKGTRSELVVMADNGQKTSFVVRIGTPITGKDGKMITLNDLKKGDKVSVQYATRPGVTSRARSIKLLE